MATIIHRGALRPPCDSVDCIIFKSRFRSAGRAKLVDSLAASSASVRFRNLRIWPFAGVCGSRSAPTNYISGLSQSFVLSGRFTPLSK